MPAKSIPSADFEVIPSGVLLRRSPRRIRLHRRSRLRGPLQARPRSAVPDAAVQGWLRVRGLPSRLHQPVLRGDRSPLSLQGQTEAASSAPKPGRSVVLDPIRARGAWISPLHQESARGIPWALRETLYVLEGHTSRSPHDEVGVERLVVLNRRYRESGAGHGASPCSRRRSSISKSCLLRSSRWR